VITRQCVVLERSRRTVHVPPGTAILETLEAEGIEAPDSCPADICGTLRDEGGTIWQPSTNSARSWTAAG
jgi:hypothetical protein